MNDDDLITLLRDTVDDRAQLNAGTPDDLDRRALTQARAIRRRHRAAVSVGVAALLGAVVLSGSMLAQTSVTPEPATTPTATGTALHTNLSAFEIASGLPVGAPTDQPYYKELDDGTFRFVAPGVNVVLQNRPVSGERMGDGFVIAEQLDQPGKPAYRLVTVVPGQKAAVIDEVDSYAVNPDDTTVAVTDSGGALNGTAKVSIRNLSTGTETTSRRLPTDSLRILAWTDDGIWVLTDEGTVLQLDDSLKTVGDVKEDIQWLVPAPGGLTFVLTYDEQNRSCSSLRDSVTGPPIVDAGCTPGQLTSWAVPLSDGMIARMRDSAGESRWIRYTDGHGGDVTNLPPLATAPDFMLETCMPEAPRTVICTVRKHNGKDTPLIWVRWNVDTGQIERVLVPGRPVYLR